MTKECQVMMVSMIITTVMKSKESMMMQMMMMMTIGISVNVSGDDGNDLNEWHKQWRLYDHGGDDFDY